MTSYLFHTGYNQARLMRSRVPIETILATSELDKATREQLQEVLKVREFAITQLKLNLAKNYLDYVDLKRPYVTWAVTAAKAWELEKHEWWFPVVGSVPYLGFFKESLAKDETKKFDKTEYDTSVRGISAFSTLGWFSDPVLSSMLAKDKHDLVNVIIHESIHATLYIPGDADFNEQVATFLGDWGTEIYFQKMYPEDKNTIELIKSENADQLLFSKFLSEELTELKGWYKQLDSKLSLTERSTLKKQRLAQMQNKFKVEVTPKLKTKNYLGFVNRELNNAILIGMSTYFEDWSDLVNLRVKVSAKTSSASTANDQIKHFSETLSSLITLKKSKDPKGDLRQLAKD